MNDYIDGFDLYDLRGRWVTFFPAEMTEKAREIYTEELGYKFVRRDRSARDTQPTMPEQE